MLAWDLSSGLHRLGSDSTVTPLHVKGYGRVPAGCFLPRALSLPLVPSVSSGPAAQLIPEKDHVSIENSSEETPISTDELRFEEEDVISSIRKPKNQRLQQLQPIPQEASFRNAAPRSEETTELTPELTPWAGRSQGRGEEAGREGIKQKRQGPVTTLGGKVGVRKKKGAGEQALKVNETPRVH